MSQAQFEQFLSTLRTVVREEVQEALRTADAELLDEDSEDADDK